MQTLQKIFFALILSSSSFLYASSEAPLYQVDLIIFTQNNNQALDQEHTIPPLVTQSFAQSIPLQSFDGENEAYQTLPSASSQLKKELWALKQNSNYQVIKHYSWLQPEDNKKAIRIPHIQNNGWDVEGMIRVRRRHFYHLDTELFFSQKAPHSVSFVLNERKRLKGNTIYYIDHPQAGLLISVHEIKKNQNV